tara:strand:+ start:418 stop:582 length:165 start_codon:yes stop_codon:yes gene_type:complete
MDDERKLNVTKGVHHLPNGDQEVFWSVDDANGDAVATCQEEAYANHFAKMGDIE